MWRRWVMLPAAVSAMVSSGVWWSLAGAETNWLVGWLLPLPTEVLQRALQPAVSSAAVASVAALLGMAILARRASGIGLAPRWVLALVLVCTADLAIQHSTLNPVAPSELFASRPRVLDAIEAGIADRVFVRDYSIAASQEARRPDLESPYQLARLPSGWP